MSNVLRTLRYFQLPQHLLESGILAKLSGGALKMFVAILYKAQHHSATFLPLTNAELKSLAGLSPNTCRRSRTELWEHRLIDLAEIPGSAMVYVLIDPATRQPLPSSSQAKYGILYEKHRRRIPCYTGAKTPPKTAGLSWNELEVRGNKTGKP
jgi:hypothetical protein